MKYPSEILKDVREVLEGKKFTGGETLDFLEEEVRSPERLMEVGGEVEWEKEVEVELEEEVEVELEEEVEVGVYSKVDLEEGARDRMEPFDLATQTRVEHVEPTEASPVAEESACWTEITRY